MSSAPGSASPAPGMPGGGGVPWMAQRYSFRTWFTYESDTTSSLGSGGSAAQTFNIAGDSDFFWTKLNAWALVGGTSTVRGSDQLASVTLLVTNTTSGRQYSSSPTPIANVGGTAQLPFILPMVTLWEAKSTIQVQLQNVGSATYSNIYLSFIGIKAFF